MAAKIIPVSVFDCVVFGATGDLTMRKLLPALYWRFRDGQMPAESRVIGVARAAMDDDAFRARAAEALEKHVDPTALDPATLQRFLACCSTAGSMPPAADGDWDDLEALPRSRARAGVLPGDRARSVRSDLPQSRRARPGHPAIARRAGKADRPRPALGARDQRPGRRGVRRSADLPHRSLPRQGDGAEPAGAALRQHDLRAAVDHRRDRPRADHGGRDGRAWRAAAAITTMPARCATWCRTTCCSCCAWWRWSRRFRWTPTGCATRS